MLITPSDHEKAEVEARWIIYPIMLTVMGSLSWLLWNEPCVSGVTLGQIVLVMTVAGVVGVGLFLLAAGGDWLSRRGLPKTDWAGRPADDQR